MKQKDRVYKQRVKGWHHKIDGCFLRRGGAAVAAIQNPESRNSAQKTKFFDANPAPP